ncbi:hypothetical protein KM043_004857 [Ampulex compressa]|nr:hypothetical protein KM043_004857 [Ampulex compressa]
MKISEEKKNNLTQNGIGVGVQPTIVKASKDRRKFNQRASDFSDIGDWPSLGAQGEKKAPVTTSKQNGVVEQNSKDGSGSNVETKDKENKEQNCSQDDSDEHTEGCEKKKKVNKQKWVPFNIESDKHPAKREHSPKYPNQRDKNAEDGDTWRDREHDRSGFNPRGGRGGRSYRGRGGRGGRGLYRGGFRHRHDQEYTNYGSDYTQMHKYGHPDPAYMMPYMGTFYFNSANYVNLDTSTLKERIRNQIEYYFSEENLLRDFFLRRKMDMQGFLPITLIASFHRVQTLTTDMALVIEAITDSDKLEMVEGFKVRTKVDPLKWPILDAMGNSVFSDPSPMPATSPTEVTSRTASTHFSPVARPLSEIPMPPVPRIIQTNRLGLPAEGTSESESASSLRERCCRVSSRSAK